MSFIDDYHQHFKDVKLANQQQYLRIELFEKVGFEKVADVSLWEGFGDLWIYQNMRQDLMYSRHASWVYLIVVNGIVYKIGETGNPLGIKSKTHSQPIAGTTNRFGRLANNNSSYTDTDARIRREIKEQVKQGLVSVWAFKCPENTTTMNIGDLSFDIQTQIHKSMEKRLLDQLNSVGALPDGNSCIK